MDSVKEKVAYLQGLAKGLDVSEETREGKLMLNILDVLDSLADEFEQVYEAQQELEEYVESIDEDLTCLEDEIYEDDDVIEDMVEVECPECHEIVTFGHDVLEDDDAVEVTCPSCGSVVYYSDEEDECCHHGHFHDDCCK